MHTFLTIMLIAVLALVASGAHGFRLRRSRLTAALASGGWLAVGAGALLGPHALRVVTPEAISSSTPLVVLGLGWIGLMIGLQMNRAVLGALPRRVVGVCAWDTVVSLVLFGAVGWFGLLSWGGAGGVWVSAVLVACTSMGWAMETRSLASGEESEWREGAVLVRTAGALSGVVALGVFGVLSAFGGAGEGVVASGATRLFVAGTLGVVAGLIGRFALREASGDRGPTLAVVLGLVAMVGGLALTFGLSSLFVAGVTGAVMANLAGHEMREFGRVILRAEHVVAAVFAILAGALLDPNIGWRGIGLAAVIAGARLVVKPIVFRRGRAPGALGWAVVRQSPLAVALAVGVVVLVGEGWTQRLLTVVVLAGVLAQLTPLLVVWAIREAPMGTPIGPVTEEPGDEQEGSR